MVQLAKVIGKVGEVNSPFALLRHKDELPGIKGGVKI